MRKTWVALIPAVAALIFVPVIAKANSGDFSGAVAVGSSYAGTVTAPTNGAAVQGSVGIGTTTPAQALEVNGVGQFDTSIILNGNEVPVAPGARLTLTSNTPVMTADKTGATTVYYADMVSDLVPVYTGSHWQAFALGGQLSLALDSNSAHTGYQQATKNFDLFVYANAGVATLCTGPAWTNATTRANAISLYNGIWTNTATITLKCDTTSSTASISANQATYVGSMYSTANGQTAMQFNPSAASGGSANILGLYNAYNRVLTISTERESTSSWNYATATWRAENNSANNSVHWIDGLGQSAVASSYSIFCANPTTNDGAAIGIDLDSTTAGPSTVSETSSSGTVTIQATGPTTPQLGYHYLAAMETETSGGTASYYPFGGAYGSLVVRIDM